MRPMSKLALEEHEGLMNMRARVHAENAGAWRYCADTESDPARRRVLETLAKVDDAIAAEYETAASSFALLAAELECEARDAGRAAGG